MSRVENTVLLQPDGRPIQALRVLCARDYPLSEPDVWIATRIDYGPADWTWALTRLVVLGLAKRTGSHGKYRWTATDDGRALVEQQSLLRAHGQAGG